MPPPKDSAPDIVGVPAAAALLGVSPQAVRVHLRAGNLKGAKLAGKYGPEWHFRPGVLQAFAAERYGRILDLDALQAAAGGVGRKLPAKDTAPESATLAELYERILALTAELADVRAIAARAEGEHAADVGHLKAELAEAKAAADSAAAAIAAEKTRADEATAALGAIRSRGFWARVGAVFAGE